MIADAIILFMGWICLGCFAMELDTHGHWTEWLSKCPVHPLTLVFVFAVLWPYIAVQCLRGRR